VVFCDRKSLMHRVMTVFLLFSGMALSGLMPLLAVELPQPKSQAVATFSGTGSKNSRPFITNSGWEVAWTTMPPRMVVNLCNAGTGRLVSAFLVESKGSNHGTSYWPKPGAFYLDISSHGDWEVTIKELPL
jgi:hypothetical protein